MLLKDYTHPFGKYLMQIGSIPSAKKDGTEYLCKLYLEGYLHGMKSYMDMKIYIGFRHDFGQNNKT